MDIKAIFSVFFSQLGVGTQYSSMTPSELNKYEAIFPNELVELWREYGLRSYLNNFFWFIKPEEYQDILHLFLPEREGIHPIIRTAFGEIIYFVETEFKLDNQIEKKFNYLSPVYKDITPMSNDIANVVNGFLTMEDIYWQKMLYGSFMRASKKLALPTFNQCYGFSPAILLGGATESSEIKIYDLKSHLTFLAQI